MSLVSYSAGGDEGRPEGDGEGRGGARPMAAAARRGGGAVAGVGRGEEVSEGILGEGRSCGGGVASVLSWWSDLSG